MLEETTYYYGTPTGEKLGPYTRQQLQELLDAGKIAESASVLTTDSGNWHLLVDVLNGDHPYRMSRRRHLGKCPRCRHEMHSASDVSYGRCPNCKFPVGTPRKVSGLRRHFFYTLRHRYMCFRGRATKAEYWGMFMVGVIGTVLSLLFLFVSFQLSADEFNVHLIKNYRFLDFGGEAAGAAIFQSVVLSIVGLFYLVCFIPALGVTVRRYHDIGHTGLWVWLYFLAGVAPVASAVLAHTDPAKWAGYKGVFCHPGYFAGVFALSIVMLVMLPLKDSKPGANRHGPSPKYPYQ